MFSVEYKLGVSQGRSGICPISSLTMSMDVSLPQCTSAVPGLLWLSFASLLCFSPSHIPIRSIKAF